MAPLAPMVADTHGGCRGRDQAAAKTKQRELTESASRTRHRLPLLCAPCALDAQGCAMGSLGVGQACVNGVPVACIGRACPRPHTKLLNARTNSTGAPPPAVRKLGARESWRGGCQSERQDVPAQAVTWGNTGQASSFSQPIIL